MYKKIISRLKVFFFFKSTIENVRNINFDNMSIRSNIKTNNTKLELLNINLQYYAFVKWRKYTQEIHLTKKILQDVQKSFLLNVFNLNFKQMSTYNYVANNF